jgi:hypothetical protein
MIVKACLLPVIYLIFYQKYSCQAKYPAGYPGMRHFRISGIRPYRISELAGYPAETVFGASLSILIKQKKDLGVFEKLQRDDDNVAKTAVCRKL